MHVTINSPSERWNARANADPEVVRTKRERLFEGAAAPINELVVRLADTNEGGAPFVDPDYGGVDAEVLLLLSDPGPKTQAEFEGSGLLSFQNDDPGAARICMLTQEVGLSPTRCVSWNAYPWYINRPPTVAERTKGLAPLRELIELLPSLRVVIAMGTTAQDSIQRLRKQHPTSLDELAVLDTVHSSTRGVTRGSRQEAAIGEAELRDAFSTALALLPDTIGSEGATAPRNSKEEESNPQGDCASSTTPAAMDGPIEEHTRPTQAPLSHDRDDTASPTGPLAEPNGLLERLADTSQLRAVGGRLRDQLRRRRARKDQSAEQEQAIQALIKARQRVAALGLDPDGVGLAPPKETNAPPQLSDELEACKACGRPSAACTCA